MSVKEQESLSVAVCQMSSNDCVERNAEIIFKMISEACAQSVRFVSFPENSLYLRVDMKNGPKYALPQDHKVFSELSILAKEKSIFIHLGSVPVVIKEQIHNVAVVIDDGGAVSFPYSKIHLFDISLEGKEPILESDYYCRGSHPCIVEVDGFHFGLSICYDLRFSELFKFYSAQEVDGLLIPAAFLPQTGEAHWEVLLRARAIESQCYVLAAAQAGEHVSKDQTASRKSHGHSMIVEPWGKVAGQATKVEEILYCELKKEQVNKVRAQVPMRQHRKQRQWSF